MFSFSNHPFLIYPLWFSLIKFPVLIFSIIRCPEPAFNYLILHVLMKELYDYCNCIILLKVEMKTPVYKKKIAVLKHFYKIFLQPHTRFH